MWLMANTAPPSRGTLSKPRSTKRRPIAAKAVFMPTTTGPYTHSTMVENLPGHGVSRLGRVRPMAVRNTSRSMTITSPAWVQVTDAVRGTSRSRAISPKY